MSQQLNVKQQAFIEHYLICWSATEAAKRAGYSPKTAYAQGSRLLNHAEVKAAIAGRIAELKASADEVLMRLAAHSRGSIADFLTEAGDVDLNAARAAGKLHLIKKLKRTTRSDDDSHVYTTTEIELYDAQAATVQLGRHHGLFADRLEIVDWREEARKAGLQPEQLVTSFEQALLTGKVETDAGDAAE